MGGLGGGHQLCHLLCLGPAVSEDCPAPARQALDGGARGTETPPASCRCSIPCQREFVSAAQGQGAALQCCSVSTWEGLGTRFVSLRVGARCVGATWGVGRAWGTPGLQHCAIPIGSSPPFQVSSLPEEHLGPLLQPPGEARGCCWVLHPHLQPHPRPPSVSLEQG